jgi:HAMP domain-containing protein
MSIRTKLVLAIIAITAAVALAMGAVVTKTAERNIRIAAEQAVTDAGRGFAGVRLADMQKLDAALAALAVHPGIVEAFAARDRARLLSLTAPIFEELKGHHDITHWYFLDGATRTCFLRVHRPELFGDVVDRATLLESMETNTIGAGLELGQTAFALRVVRPFRDAAGTLLGYMELGEEIDHFAERIKEQTGDDYGIVFEKRFLDPKAWASMRHGERNDWDDRPTTVVVQSTVADRGLLEFPGALEAIPEQGQLLGDVRVGPRTFARGVLPVLDASDKRVGVLFVLHDISALRESMGRARIWMMWMLLAVAAITSILLVLVANRLVFGRLKRMVATMEDLSARLAGGDYDVAPPPVTARDEIGQFESFLGGFLRVVAGLLKELTRSKSA